MSNPIALTKQQVIEGKTQFEPGDFIVTHGDSLFNKLIQFFTKSYWNHTALIVSYNGDIIELATTGIRQITIEEYKDKQWYLIKPHMSIQDRQQVLKYAFYMLNKHDSYGFITILSICCKIIFGSHLVLKRDGTFICSEFVANALMEGGFIFDKDTSLITPADLYNLFTIQK